MKIYNYSLRLLLMTNAMVLIGAAMFAPISAIFVDDIGGDILDASLAGTLFAGAACLTTILSGEYSDRVRENELIIVIGYSIIGMGFLLLTITSSVWMLLIVQVIIGLGEAIYSPAYDAVYSKHLTPKLAGKQWGAWESMNYFTYAVGSLLGGVIVTKTSFDVLFLIMAIIIFVSAAIILFTPRKVL